MLYYDVNVELFDLCSLDHLRMAAASLLTERARGKSIGDEEGEEEQHGEEELGFMFSERRLLGGGKRQLHSLDFKMAVIGTSTHFRIFNVYIDGVNTVPVLAQTGVNYLWGRK
jgi:hypothetical protein